MRVLLKISPLLICIIASQTVFADEPDFAQCTGDIDSLVKKNEPNIYGGLNAFYDINKGIADGLQKSMSDEMVKDIYGYIEGSSGHKSLGTIINDVVKSQAGAIAFFCVGLLFILVSIILAITICSCRCCCNSCGAKKDDVTYPSVWSAAGMIAGLFSIFAFVLTGVIIFNISSNNLYDAVDKSPAWIAKVVNELNDVVTDGTGQMTCTINDTVTSTFTQLEGQMNDYPGSLITQYENNTGLNQLFGFNYTILTSALVDAKGQAALAKEALDRIAAQGQCLAQKDSISQQLDKTTQDLDATALAVGNVNTASDEAKTETNTNADKLTNGVSGPLQQATAQLTNVQNDINKGMGSVTGGVNQTMQTIYSLQNAINTAQHDITTWSGYKPVRASWQAAMSVPNCICLFFALATVVLLGLWIFKGNDTPRGLGYVAIVGFYFVIFLAWLAMLVTSVTFVAGWGISGVCKPMFEDPTFRVYGIANGVGFTITGFGGTQSNVTMQQLLQSCSKGDTMFKAINGDNLISVDMVLNMLDLGTPLAALNAAIGQVPLKYDFDDNDQLRPALNLAVDQILGDKTFFDTTNSLTDCDQNDDNVKEANTQLAALKKSLDDIYPQLKSLQGIIDTVATNAQDPNNIQQQKLQDFTNDQFQIVNSSISLSITSLTNQLDTTTFPCYPLYESYENAGTIICDWFGRPVHGMWGAAGLAAIFFIPAALLLLCASKTLFTGHREKSFDPVDERGLYADVPPSSVHRTKTTQDPWAAEEDPFALPKIHSDAPQQLPRITTTNDYYPSQPTAAAAAPWLDDSVSKGSGLRRMDEGLQRNDNYNPYEADSGLRRNDYPESSRRLGGDDRWGSDSASGSGTGSRGLRRVNGDTDINPPEERWSSTALRRL